MNVAVAVFEGDIYAAAHHAIWISEVPVIQSVFSDDRHGRFDYTHRDQAALTVVVEKKLGI